MLDSAKNYSYYLLSNDTIYAYKIKDSIGDGGAIVAESMIDQYLNFEEKVEVNYHALNGRTSYIYAVNKRNNIKTLDHIIPRSKGGASVWENVVTCCKPCNQIKCDKEIPIKHNSFMPSYWDIVKRLKKRPISIHHHWLPYIDWPEELITVTKRAA